MIIDQWSKRLTRGQIFDECGQTQMANELEAQAKEKRLGDSATMIQACLRGHKVQN